MHDGRCCATTIEVAGPNHKASLTKLGPKVWRTRLKASLRLKNDGLSFVQFISMLYDNRFCLIAVHRRLSSLKVWRGVCDRK